MIKIHPIILLLLIFACGIANAGNLKYPDTRITTSFPAGDGKLTIYSYHLDELIDVEYRKGDKYNHEALKKLQHIFRSRLDDKEHSIDIGLIELIDNIQDHFGADAIEIISVYRSLELNRKLKEEGIKVAQESLHMQGLAADIHIDEITEEALAEYARSLKVGGVGYYPANDFVHVDTGRIATWNAPDTKERLMLGFKKSNDWEIITGKNVYLPNEAISFEIGNITNEKKRLDGPVIIELFRRGKWAQFQKIKYPSDKEVGAGGEFQLNWAPKESDPFGKYRIIISEPKGFQHLGTLSNEFYRKKD